MLLQSAADWGVVFKSFTKEQRRSAAALAVRSEGCDTWLLQNSGLQMMLAPLTKPIAPGSRRRFLTSAYHRATIQAGHGWAMDCHMCGQDYCCSTNMLNMRMLCS
jgi:hypothetical protein